MKMHTQVSILSIALISIAGCGGGGSAVSSKTPAEFSASDAGTTAKWCFETLAPLNAIPDSSNKLAREDEINAAISKAKSVSDQFVGQKVSWKTVCAVSESSVTLGNKFGANGRIIPMDFKDNPIAMMLLDERPAKMSSIKDDPRYWYFQLDVPEQVSIDEAKQLSDDVIVHATVKEIEIARYRDREVNKAMQNYEDEWYLMYVYLKDIKIESVK